MDFLPARFSFMSILAANSSWKRVPRLESQFHANRRDHHVVIGADIVDASRRVVNELHIRPHDQEWRH